MLIRSNYTATVLRVIDGDTILITIECPCCGITSTQRLRLARIDAPEKVKGGENSWNASKNYLANLVDQKTVIVLLCQKWPDRYGRLVGEVLLDGVNVSNKMMESGFAKLYVSGVSLA